MTGSRGPIRLNLPSEAKLLSVVRAALFALVERDAGVRLTPTEADEVAVALQEACTNTIRHAHRLCNPVRSRLPSRR